MPNLFRSALVLLPALSLLACFEDPAANTTMSSQTGDGDETETSASSGDGDGDPTTTGDGDGDPTTGDGDGDAELGPQLVSSWPQDGDMQAPISPYFLLTFDRVVSAADATGKITVSQAGGDPIPVVIMPCPNADPTCLAGIYPMNLAADGGLPSDTAHQIIIAANFPDPDGFVNTRDQLVDYTTFFYQDNWFTDAGDLEEVGGIAYHPATEALFVSVHNTVQNPNGPIIRRIAMPGGSPQPAMTAAMPDGQGGGGPWSYGLDISGDQLMSSMSYASRVGVYTINGAMLNLVEYIGMPTLPAPYDNLDEVDAVTRTSDNRYLMAFGDYFGGPDRIGVVQLAANNQWSIFNDGTNLWASNGPGTTLTSGSIAGTEYLFVHNYDTIYQFRLSDGQLVQEHVVGDDSYWDPHLEVASDRLFFGSNQGLIVYEVTANGFTELGRRDGLRAGRFGVRMDGQIAHVYYAGYRDDPVLGYTRFDF